MRSAEDIMRLYGSTLYRTALNLTGHPEDAEDMVQETMIRWFTKRPDFESDEHEKAWLLRVIINLSINLLNSAPRRKSCELLDIYPAEEPEEESLIAEVMRLPEDQRAVIHLYYYEGYSVKEVAEILNKNENTVRSLMHRARKRLKGMLEEETV